QIHIARHSVSSPSPPPLQHHQHQHQQQYQRKPQHLSNQYFPAGSTVELTKRETGELIRGAEVLLHDPIGDCIVVRLAARSGRPGLFDVHYYNLAFVDVRIHTMPDSAGTVSPSLTLKKCSIDCSAISNGLICGSSSSKQKVQQVAVERLPQLQLNQLPGQLLDVLLSLR
ncbi:hypothetical protein BOX15_Mlig019456g2, partial [Macrostomum lignano]